MQAELEPVEVGRVESGSISLSCSNARRASRGGDDGCCLSLSPSVPPQSLTVRAPLPLPCTAVHGRHAPAQPDKTQLRSWRTAAPHRHITGPHHPRIYASLFTAAFINSTYQCATHGSVPLPTGPFYPFLDVSLRSQAYGIGFSASLALKQRKSIAKEKGTAGGGILPGPDVTLSIVKNWTLSPFL
jgi:hypothetical protein